MRLEKEDMSERLDMCDGKDNGSAPDKGLLPFVVAGEDGLLDKGW